jgi:tRNA threonylcarbamoyladenosine biosynthesis protein TsaE
MPSGVRVFSESPSQTRAAGRKLGKLLCAGGTVYLYGELGSGKTVFTKGLASAFGIPEKEMASASFILIAEHEGKLPTGVKIPFYHIDLYRLTGTSDAINIGINEYLDSKGITVVEWADRLPEPGKGNIKVHINIVSRHKREIIIEGISNK